MGKARIAFRFGHYGDCYHGSQVQPDVPTVQGEFMHIFKKKLKWTKERMPVPMASRTDSCKSMMNGVQGAPCTEHTDTAWSVWKAG